MDIRTIYEIEDEAEQVNRIYDVFNEDTRLTHSRSARTEFLTTVHYIEQYLKPGMRILDLGAGTGIYSLWLAKQGYHVDAVELADANIRAFREKITPGLPVELVQGNALDLSCYEDGTFDIVLLFGPLYHLHAKADRDRCIAETKRVCRKDGIIFISFINHDMIFISELNYNPQYFSTGGFDHETLRLDDFPFVFFTLDECREMLKSNGIAILKEIASDGASELMQKQIDQMTDEEYELYLKYHYMVCEKPEQLGFTNHFLFVGRQ